MRVDISERDDSGDRHRAAYRLERDVLANATTEHLVGLLGADDELRRMAARDELLRRGQPVSTLEGPCSVKVPGGQER